MKGLNLIILILIASSSCSSQNKNFESFLGNFQSRELPIELDKKTFGNIFFPKGVNKEIPVEFVKEFICLDTLNCDFITNEYRYDYGNLISLSKDYYTVLIHKQRFEGDAPDNFDLSETIIITYNKKGEILSNQSLGKGNDVWFSIIEISREGNILVKQVKIIEFNEPNMTCEVIEKEYEIQGSGKIMLLKTSSPKKRIATWSDISQDYILKHD